MCNSYFLKAMGNKLYLLLSFVVLLACSKEKESIEDNNGGNKEEIINNQYVGRVYISQEKINRKTPIYTSTAQEDQLRTALWACPSTIVTQRYEDVDSIFDIETDTERKGTLTFVDNNHATLNTVYKGTIKQRKASVWTHYYTFTGDYNNETVQYIIQVTKYGFRVYDKSKSINYSYSFNSDYSGSLTFIPEMAVGVTEKNINDNKTTTFLYSEISNNYLKIINEADSNDVRRIYISETDEISLHYDGASYLLKRDK